MAAQSPLKRLTQLQRDDQQAAVPGSPEMKQARAQLGNLLKGVRDTADGGDPYAFDGDVSRDGTTTFGGQQAKRNLFDRGGMPMPITAPRRKRERRVVFELRSKPFELHDRKREMALYELCRLWVGGRDDGTDPADRELPSHTNVKNEPMGVLDDARLDLLATKDIHTLPVRDPTMADLEPTIVPHAMPVEEMDNAHAWMQAYKSRWKNVKEQHVKHAFDRQQPYSKSLALLETVFSIAQENQV